MSLTGTVRNGKIEVDGDLAWPDGTRVIIEQSTDDWVREWKELAHEVTRKWKSPLSAVELLSEMRR